MRAALKTGVNPTARSVTIRAMHPYRSWILVAVTLLVPAASLGAAGKPRPTVAILYFDYQGKTEGMTVLRKGLAQMLITDLSSNEAFQIVERDRLEELLAEQKLGLEGKLDSATAAKVGKLLGARYVVLGGYFDFAQALRIDARLVEVETGKILGSAGTTGSPGDCLGVEQKIATDLGRLLSEKTSPADPTALPVKRPPRVQPPSRLPTDTARRYSEALDDADKGRKEAAKAKLEKILMDQPDFVLASVDLDRLKLK